MSTAKTTDDTKDAKPADATPPEAAKTPPPAPAETDDAKEIVRANREATKAAEADPPPPPPAEPPTLTAEDAERVVYRYVGPAEVYGIPARDLTALDVARLTPSQLRDATLAAPGRAPLYEPAD